MPTRRPLFLALCAFLPLTLPLTLQATDPAPRLGLIINEDNSHFFGTRDADDMTIEGLQAWVDQYADTEVSHLFLNPSAMKTSYASEVRGVIWELTEHQKKPSGKALRWPENAKLLHERGLDPYTIWINRSREKGISPWISMRMNDVHEASDTTNHMHSPYWIEHPEYWRIPGDEITNWVDRGLDYNQPALREYAMALVRELLERYYADGLELDWMRFGWHFKPGEESQGGETLTHFMREVRELVDEYSIRWGHPIQLGVRVPANPDAADGLGMPGAAWAREGLIDWLVPTPFWTTTDFDIPVQLWRARLGAAADHVVLAPGIEYNMRAWPKGQNVPNTLETTRGWAAMAWEQGADQLYLFNYMDSQTLPVSVADYRRLLEDGLGPTELARQPRRHPQTYRDTVPLGSDAGIVLPAALSVGLTLSLNLGTVLENDTNTFILGLDDTATVDVDLVVKINGVPCQRLADHPAPDMFPASVRALQFACPPQAVVSGHNTFVVAPLTDAPAVQII
ncbi:MAG: hypothetical protein QNK90_03815 [Opitutaceae bacterium]